MIPVFKLESRKEGEMRKILGCLLLTGAAAAAAGSGYQAARTLAIGGEGGWDYVTVDAAGRRLFVSHGNEVEVVDLKSGKVTGKIPDTQGVHGIAVASAAGRGYVSNGRTDNVTMFDLKTLKTLGTIPTGKKPDAIIYDKADGVVMSFNGESGSTTVIDAATGKVNGTIDLGGGPEFAVADGKGKVYVNLEDKSEILQLDPKALKVDQRWPLKPCEEPSALSMDQASRRLFVGCRNKMMAVVDADTGKVVATVPIGRGVDAGRFDPKTKFAFASCGDGTTTVVHEDSPDKFTVVDTLTTKVSARTMELDPVTHNIYLPFAEVTPAPGGGRPKIVPGTFAVLEMSRK